MTHFLEHGEGGEPDGRPRYNRCVNSDFADYEPRTNLLCDPSRGEYNSQRQGLNEMSLKSEHQTHIHHVFYALCSERKWALGFPTSFDYDYLPEHFKKVQARIVLTEGKPLILFHPSAFDKCDGNLVKGLLHHELCHHLLGADVAHGPLFNECEQAWDGYYLFKQESSDFARWLARQNPQFMLDCLKCGSKYMRNTVTVGRMACRRCCDEYANGEYDDNYALHIGGAYMTTT